VPETPLLYAFFKQTTYNRWRKRHDNLVSTLTLTQCEPRSFEKSWLRPLGLKKCPLKRGVRLREVEDEVFVCDWFRDKVPLMAGERLRKLSVSGV